MENKMRTVLLLGLVLLVGCKKKPPVDEGGPVDTTPVPVENKPPVATTPEHVNQMRANFERVFFDFDSSTLGGDSKAALDDNVRIMLEHNDVKVEVQGHADERGTTDYNIALGQRRAQSVVDYMQAKGVAGSRVKVVSYGEEKPLVSGSSEQAWSQNRRAEFVILYGGDGSVTGTTP
jgi:peptidoglycan-associated lipoprotein